VGSGTGQGTVARVALRESSKTRSDYLKDRRFVLFLLRFNKERPYFGRLVVLGSAGFRHRKNVPAVMVRDSLGLSGCNAGTDEVQHFWSLSRLDFIITRCLSVAPDCLVMVNEVTRFVIVFSMFACWIEPTPPTLC